MMARRDQNTNTRDWREKIGAGAHFFGVADGQLFWGTVGSDVNGTLLGACLGGINGVLPLDDVRGDLVGLATGEQNALATKLGSDDPAALEALVGADPAWPRRAEGLVYDPAARSIVAPASTDEVQLVARNRLFGIWACVTERGRDEILDARFWANVATAFELHDRIEVTCLADPVRPLHLGLVVDALDRARRGVAVKIIHECAVERALPAAPAASAGRKFDAA